MSLCEQCAYFAYDETLDDYECMVNLDEDDLYRFYSNNEKSCPFFRLDDEYAVVRKQN